jgi:hypothetical protein
MARLAQWVRLPEDADEPPLGSLVLDGEGDPWLRTLDDAHAGGGQWLEFSGDGLAAADPSADWDHVRGFGTVRLFVVPDPVSTPPGEAREERERTAHAAYLAASEAQRRAFEVQADAWPQILDMTREWLALAQPVPYVRVDDDEQHHAPRTVETVNLPDHPLPGC